MNKDNRNAQLGDLYDFQYGTGNTIENIGGDYPIYGSNGAVGFTNIYNSEDAPVIGHIGAYAGIVNWASGKHYVTYNGVICKIKKGINARYGYYTLLNSRLQKRLRGSTQPFISYDLLNDVKVYLPEKLTQDSIASVLSILDSKIELNNHINIELEAMTKTLYDYWFVQFDFPNQKGQPYKSSGGEMVYDEELGKEIPVDWRVFKIRDLLKTSLGGTPSTSNKEFWDNGTVNWLNSGEIANFPIIESELKITESAIKSSATELLPRGTTMLSITRHLRPSVLAIDACANQSVVGIKETSSIKYYFLYPYLVNEIPRLMSLRSGAQQPHINKETVDDSLILIPNENSLLEKYYSKVASSYELIMSNSMENKKLSELRDWLLPMLMNGQVKVK